MFTVRIPSCTGRSAVFDQSSAVNRPEVNIRDSERDNLGFVYAVRAESNRMMQSSGVGVPSDRQDGDHYVAGYSLIEVSYISTDAR